MTFCFTLGSLFISADIKLHKILKKKDLVNIITTKEFKQIIRGL